MPPRSKLSAGILLFRRRSPGLEVFLVHPGGPFWARKDDGAWSIPKGEYAEGEAPLEAAKREFEEETGASIAVCAKALAPPAASASASASQATFTPLTPVKASGKTLSAWCIEGDLDPGALRSNVFSMEWPPKSGKTREFPEVDRGGWFSPADARRKLLLGQHPFLDEFVRLLGPPI